MPGEAASWEHRTLPTAPALRTADPLMFPLHGSASMLSAAQVPALLAWVVHAQPKGSGGPALRAVAYPLGACHKSFLELPAYPHHTLCNACWGSISCVSEPVIEAAVMQVQAAIVGLAGAGQVGGTLYCGRWRW